MDDWRSLAARVDSATGADAKLDRELADGLGCEVTACTGSAEAARDWVAAALPGWHIHVGFDASGVFPYAALSQGNHHVDGSGPTVPLALLRAALKALQHLQGA